MKTGFFTPFIKNTVCPRSRYPFYIVSFYMKLVTAVMSFFFNRNAVMICKVTYVCTQLNDLRVVETRNILSKV